MLSSPYGMEHQEQISFSNCGNRLICACAIGLHVRISDVNKDLTFKDKDKDQTLKAKDQDKD